ncbi:hypothetical protein EA94_02783 [Enterococcus faecalis]|nr:hypothetical protein EA94_02783 [Enterococcus faecalis]
MIIRRKLFCEVSPLTYKISYELHVFKRKVHDLITGNIATEKSKELLPHKVFSHKSLMRRGLHKVPIQIEEAKVTNLRIASPKISNIIIKPGEVFSFWNLIGRCTEKEGYQMGLMIHNDGELKKGTGGGLCQFSNLIHWMILHTPLEIVEKHHHEQIDMFPDAKRDVPFGSGTSIVFNYLDYRFKNTTKSTYQLVTFVSDNYLHGELYSSDIQNLRYEVKIEQEKFVQKDDKIYRCGKIYQYCYDNNNTLINRTLIKVNHAEVLYSPNNIDIVDE